MKTFCPTHCFNYTGNVCPFCEQDKISAYARKYTQPKPVVKQEEYKPKQKQDIPQQVTQDMLDALSNKFGPKFKK